MKNLFCLSVTSCNTITSINDDTFITTDTTANTDTTVVNHIVPVGKFHRIGDAPSETFPNVKYDAPDEVGGDRKCFDIPNSKFQILHNNSSRDLREGFN